jgi:hypothetical protein
MVEETVESMLKVNGNTFEHQQRVVVKGVGHFYGLSEKVVQICGVWCESKFSAFQVEAIFAQVLKSKITSIINLFNLIGIYIKT